MEVIRRIIIALCPMIVTFAMHVILVIGMDIYNVFSNFDIFMHITGGIVSAWSVYLLYNIGKEYFKFKISPKILLCIFIVCAVGLIGIGWEVYEHVHDMFSPVIYQMSIGDTIWDLILDLLGALVFCVGYLGKKAT